MRLFIFLLLASSISASSSSAVEIALTHKPTVKKVGEGFEIRFTVSHKTDVEVAIVNREGRVVRHLAAGVLGGQLAPPPPLAPGLSQTLAWDGKDDRGERARRGPFEVRVRAGFVPRLGRIIGNPAQINPSPHYNRLFGLATDERGQVYVASGSVYSNTPVYAVKVYDRQGKYLRTILPMPANLTPAQVEEFGGAQLRDGFLTPANYDPLAPYVQPGGIVAFLGSRVRDGVLWLLSTEGRICRIRAGDGRPLAWKSGPQTYKPSGGPMCWSVSPDGKSLWLAGHWNARATQSGGKIPFDDGVLYRVDPATGRGKPLLKIDVPRNAFWKTETNGWYHFKNWGRKNGNAAMHGVDVDRRGRLLVCDRVSQRLAVYDAHGKPLGGTDVEWPDQVAQAADGSVYVSTRRVVDGYKAINELKLIKLSSAIDGKVLAQLTLTGRNAPLMAVDTSTTPAVIWLSNVGREGDKLVRIEDRGDKLLETGGLQTGEPFGGVVKVWVDPGSDDVYINDGWNNLGRYDGLSGKGGPIPIKAIDMAFDDAGRLYLYGREGWNEPVYRCDRDFAPVPFSATGKPETELTLAVDNDGRRRPVYGRYGTGWSNKGIDVGGDGRIYVRCMYDWSKYFVTVFKPDGTAGRHDRIQGGILGPLSAASGGIRVDRDGYLYVGTDGQPAGAKDDRRWAGSIVKVKPTGGGIVALPPTDDAATPESVQPARGIAFADYLFEGAVSAYPRMSPRQNRGCVCMEARFDVDEFGRVYVPDVLQFCIHVYDNAGNLLAEVGHYGNCDDVGRPIGGGLEQSPSIPSGGDWNNPPPNGRAGPPIPFGWPMSCAVNQAGRLYVADVLNQRIVRVDPAYAVEAVVALP